MSKIEEKLDEVLEWANGKLSEGKEPPWSWYQFMKLREAIEAIRSGATYIPISPDLPQSDEHQETGPRQAGCIAQLDTARHRRDGRRPQKPN